MSQLLFSQDSIPKRIGKQYKTQEECLKENGEHVWSNSFDPNSNISCCVMHYDGVCSLHTPKQICLHCPAEQLLVTKQKEIKEWKLIED